MNTDYRNTYLVNYIQYLASQFKNLITECQLDIILIRHVMLMSLWLRGLYHFYQPFCLVIIHKRKTTPCLHCVRSFVSCWLHKFLCVSVRPWTEIHSLLNLLKEILASSIELTLTMLNLFRKHKRCISIFCNFSLMRIGLFSENTKRYLHFLSFLDADISQVIKIFIQWKASNCLIHVINIMVADGLDDTDLVCPEYSTPCS